MPAARTEVQCEAVEGTPDAKLDVKSEPSIASCETGSLKTVTRLGLFLLEADPTSVQNQRAFSSNFINCSYCLAFLEHW